MKKTLITLLALLFSTLPGTPQQFELYEPISSFQADRGALQRKYTLRETQEYYDRMSRLYSDWLAYVESVDYASLSSDGKIDYLMFRNFLQKAVFFHELEEQEFQQVAFVTDFAGELYQFIRERRRGKTVDGPKKAALFHTSSERFRKAAADLERTPRFENWMAADKAKAVVRDLRENLAEAFHFYYGYHPDFTWWAKAPYEQLMDALTHYEKKVEGHYAADTARDDGSGIVGKPEGRHALINRLQYEYIPYTPEELLVVGREQLEWCRNEMILASREMGFGDDWRAALEHVKDQYVPAGEQPAMINRLAEEAIAFIEDNDLLTVPELAKETWRMLMMSPEMQLVNPFFLGGEAIRISYPTNTMDHDAKMMSLRGNNPHFCMATVHHELIAGHHLQGFVNQRNKPYRRLMGTPFWLEGWAIYWEFLLYEKGLPPTPEDRMGFLFWRKHRAARIIFSLNYHLGNMSPQECIDFLVREVGHERANAEAEVRRSFMGRYDPLYQLAYMIGGIQFQALRTELVDGGHMTFREFHDAVLKQNSIPVELLRAILTGRELPQDYRTSWRFLEN